MISYYGQLPIIRHLDNKITNTLSWKTSFVIQLHDNYVPSQRKYVHRVLNERQKWFKCTKETWEKSIFQKGELPYDWQPLGLSGQTSCHGDYVYHYIRDTFQVLLAFRWVLEKKKVVHSENEIETYVRILILMMYRRSEHLPAPMSTFVWTITIIFQ